MPGPSANRPDHRPDHRPEAVRSLLERRVQVVAGKGGVGRTLLASAIALRSAERGARTLLLEVNAPDNAAAQLGVAPAIDDPREVLNNLWLCRMTPAGSLHEYALLVLKFKALYNLVFENRLVKYLLRSIPSLAEFTMLGKAWYHTTETFGEHQPRFHRVVIDAPATGHAITFLSAARTVADISPPGVMKQASERMAEMVESARETCLHVACIAEEMPVNEGLDIVQAARARLGMSLGLGFVNRMLPPLLGREEDAEVFQRLAAAAGPEPRLRPYVEAAARRLDREAWQREHADRFRAGCGLPVIEVPDFGGNRIEPRELAKLVAVLDRAAGTDEPRIAEARG